jgi:RND family efflux transporter MFP subunit
MSPRHRSVLVYLVGGVVLVATVLGVVGLGSHRRSQAREDAQAREATIRKGPRVRVAPVKTSPGLRHLTLQGEARAYAEVTIFAKVAGFLHDLRVDRGDRVKRDQLLATVTAPELDSQYLAAVADAKNKRITANRLTALQPSGVVSVQELDTGRAAADVADANEAALATQRGYRVIKAPFDGIVTARFADPGTLIQSAANGQSGAVPIVAVARADKLRVFVYVDQASAAFVRSGDAAKITVGERPGWSRDATVSRTTGSLSPKTRTMQTEVDVENTDGAIVPGSFVEVTLSVRVPTLMEIPSEGLITRGEKMQVALVQDGKVHYRPVVLADDDGQTARLVSGVAAGDRVALNLGSDVEDGGAVQEVAPAKPPEKPPGR